MILVLLNGGLEFSGQIATAISFGRSARQNKLNPWPIGRRAIVLVATSIPGDPKAETA
jgi:hypothetical protein